MLKEVSIDLPLTSGFTHILFQLAALDYTHMTIDYSGADREIIISSIRLYKENNIVEEAEGSMILDKDSAPYDILSEDWDNCVNEHIKEILNTQLGKWCKDDGGQGTFYIITHNGVYYCDHEVNYMSRYSEPFQGKLTN